jgi:hypothetical protein
MKAGHFRGNVVAAARLWICWPGSCMLSSFVNSSFTQAAARFDIFENVVDSLRLEVPA